MNRTFPAVKAIIQNNNKFLVIKQIVGNSIIWDLPGGKVEYGESPYDTLKREVKEEVNLDIEILQPIGIWWFFRIDNNDQVVCTTFVCKPRTNDIDLTRNPAQENISEFRWVTKDEFLGDKYPTSHESLKKLISEILK